MSVISWMKGCMQQPEMPKLIHPSSSGRDTSMKAISVALLFTPLVASMRGYYQGRQNMRPTAITEVIEQMVRVIVGLSLAYAFYKTSLEKAAAGATFGASAGIIAALILMMTDVISAGALINALNIHNDRKNLIGLRYQIQKTEEQK